MKPGGGKAKGKSFERGVCKILSLWITGADRSDILVPSTLSGGIVTRQIKQSCEQISEHQVGDIAMAHPDAAEFINAFSVECKSYKDAGIQAVLYASSHALRTRDTVGLLGWWIQCQEDAANAGKVPLLVWKQNRRITMVGIGSALKRAMDEVWGPCGLWSVYFTHIDLWCAPLTSFLGTLKPELISHVASIAKSHQDLLDVVHDDRPNES